MKRLRALKKWWLLGFLVFAGWNSLAHAQTNTFPANGSVGVGTTNPGAKFHIFAGNPTHVRIEGSGEAQAGIELFPASTHPDLRRWAITTYANLYQDLDILSSASSTSDPSVSRFHIDGRNGSVGIGTTNPSAKFHIFAGNPAYLKIEGSGEAQAGIQLFPASSHPDLRRWAIATYANLYQDLDILSSVNSTAGPSVSRFHIDGKNGNVGIGTTSPTAKLQVAGDVTVDGNIAAKYQDVAEWVPAPKGLPSGTVVVIDPTETNRVLPTSLPYDSRVAGVVSYQPGIILGEAGENKAKVAHSGRAKVKADAAYGSIAVGDLLVTSPNAGYVMRSTPVEVSGISIHRPGTIVGKALEPLKEGQSEILVLLTLQ